MTKKYQKEIKRVTQKIVREYKPEKIILFGSYAWGEPGEWSDLDLFILKQSKKRRIDRERELRKKLFGHNFPPIDILIYTPGELKKRIEIEDLFIEDILKKGKIIYEKK